eukprot:SM000016S01839  [mRNA]  locus=s16:149226:150011:- [translate_table: standard]
MAVVAGRHAGLLGEVLAISRELPESGRSDRAVLRLARSEEKVEVRLRELADVGSVEEEQAAKARRDDKDAARRSHGHGHPQGEGRRRDASGGVGRASAAPNGQQELGNGVARPDRQVAAAAAARESDCREAPASAAPLQPPPWLMSRIRVRIVSQRLRGGALYLKKGTVADVVTRTSADVLLDESRELVQGVRQEDLETVLPKRGGRVVVVGGEHCGTRGTLLEKDTAKGVAVVRLGESFEIVRIHMDLVADNLGEADHFE